MMSSRNLSLSFAKHLSPKLINVCNMRVVLPTTVDIMKPYVFTKPMYKLSAVSGPTSRLSLLSTGLGIHLICNFYMFFFLRVFK